MRLHTEKLLLRMFDCSLFAFVLRLLAIVYHCLFVVVVCSSFHCFLAVCQFNSLLKYRCTAPQRPKRTHRHRDTDTHSHRQRGEIKRPQRSEQRQRQTQPDQSLLRVIVVRLCLTPCVCALLCVIARRSTEAETLSLLSVGCLSLVFQDR